MARRPSSSAQVEAARQSHYTRSNERRPARRLPTLYLQRRHRHSGRAVSQGPLLPQVLPHRTVSSPPIETTHQRASRGEVPIHLVSGWHRNVLLHHFPDLNFLPERSGYEPLVADDVEGMPVSTSPSPFVSVSCPGLLGLPAWSECRSGKVAGVGLYGEQVATVRSGDYAVEVEFIGCVWDGSAVRSSHGSSFPSGNRS